MENDLWESAVADVIATARQTYDKYGGELFERPGVIGVVNSRILIDCWVYGDDVDLGPVLAYLKTTAPWPNLNVVMSHPDLALVEKAGWIIEEQATQMVLPRRDALVAVEPPPGVRIEPVVVPDGIAEFHAAMNVGFGGSPGDAESWLPTEVILTSGPGLYVARDENAAVVGTAAWRRRVRSGSLFAISVPPAHRGRGIGGALTTAASAAAFDSGVEFVQLQATAAGHHVYERAGFRVAGVWMFHRPPDDLSDDTAH